MVKRKPNIVEREAKEGAEQKRKAKIKELLSFVQSNDNKADGKKALEALKELLQLDPSHSQALTLQKKISGYYGADPGDVLTNSIGMKLKLIPAGTFMMGWDDGEARERPSHEVEITKSFYIGVYEVTQEQYVAIMGHNPSHFKGRDKPVESVSFLGSKRIL